MTSSRAVLVLDASGGKRSLVIGGQSAFMQGLSRAYEVETQSAVVTGRPSFFKAVGKLRSEPVDFVGLHIIGHAWGNSRKAQLSFPGQRQPFDLANPHDLERVEDLGVAWILLSCCGLGRNLTALTKLRDKAGAWAVFAYNTEVYDDQCFLVDAMLYHLLLKRHLPEYEDSMTPKRIQQRANKAIASLLLWRGRPGSAPKPLVTVV